MTNRPLNEEAIFHIARDLPDSEKRAAYLDQVCAGDPALHQRVEGLLRAYEEERGFLKSNDRVASTVDSSETIKDAPLQIGPYKIREQIGEGGMGIVYVAEQQKPVKRKVALKVIKPGMDSKEVVARFEAERQALAMMDHPGIAKVFDGGVTETGQPYFAMELINGIPITQYADEQKLGIRERLDLFVAVCHAVQHAHQKGVIHRDIKPTNVLVTLHDGKPVPVVIDFGVAKATNQNLTDQTIYTRLNQVIGTTLYMSPEQAELSRFGVDTRTDIYSLGVLLYEMLAGTTPFERERFKHAALDEVRRIIREEEPPKPSTRLSTLGDNATKISSLRRTDPHKLRHSLRGDLDWIVMMSLEKDRNRRYETANGLAMDVTRFLNDEPILARPPSTWYRMQKFYYRNRLLVVSATAIVAALVLGLAITWSAWQFAIKQKVVADQKAQALVQKTEQLTEVKKTIQGEVEDARYQNYLADLNIAVGLWEKGNVDGAIELLKQWQDYERRDIEYNFVANLVRPRSIISKFQLPSASYELLHAGDKLSLVNLDGQPALSDRAGNITELRGKTSVSTMFIKTPMASSGHEVAYIESTDETETVTVVDVSNLNERELSLPGDVLALSLAALPNGSICVGANDGKVYVSNSDGKIDSLSVNDEVRIRELAVSPDGSLLAAAGRYIQLYSTDDLVNLPESNPQPVRLDFDPEQTFGTFTNIQHLAISRDNSLVAFAQFAVDNSIQLFSTTGKLLAVLSGHENLITEVEFSPVDDLLFASSRDGTIRVWDTATYLPIATLRGHSSYVLDFDIRPLGQSLVSSGLDGSVIEWDIKRVRQHTAFALAKVATHVGAPLFNQDANAFYTCGFSTSPAIPLTRYDLAIGNAVTFGDKSRGVKHIAIHEKRQLAACVFHGKRGLEILKLESNSSSPFPISGIRHLRHFNLSANSDFSPSGKRYLQRLNRNGKAELHIFDVDAVEPWQPTDQTQIDGSSRSEWSADENVIATAVGTEIRLIDVVSKKTIRRIKTDHTTDILRVRYSPDNKLIASCGFDSSLQIWNTETGEAHCPAMNAHSGKVWNAVFSRDNRRLFSVGGDGNISAWNTESGQKLVTVRAHVGGGASLDISRDDSRLITGGLYDGKVRVWELGDVTDDFWD